MDCTIREKETKFAKELQRKEKEVLFAANYYLRKGKGDISLAILHRQILFIYSVKVFSIVSNVRGVSISSQALF